MNIPSMPNPSYYFMPTASVTNWEGYSIALQSWGKRGWAEAERLEAEKESHEDAHWYEVGQNNALRSQLDACYTALGTTFYMDPPDGGDPGIAVMIGRMKAHRDELMTQVKELAEALGLIKDLRDLERFESEEMRKIARAALSRLESK